MVQVVEPHPCQTARRQWEPFPGTRGRVLLVRGLAGWAAPVPIPGPRRAHTPKGPDWDGHEAPGWTLRGGGQRDQSSDAPDRPATP